MSTTLLAFCYNDNNEFSVLLVFCIISILNPGGIKSLSANERVYYNERIVKSKHKNVFGDFLKGDIIVCAPPPLLVGGTAVDASYRNRSVILLPRLHRPPW